jgi:hypothetical protein
VILFAVLLAELAAGALISLFAGLGLVASENWAAVVATCAIGFLFSVTVVGCLWDRDKKSILYDTFLYATLASAFYFFVGPLVYVFGSAEVVDYIFNQYPVSATDVVQITALHLVGLAIAGLAYQSVKFTSLSRWAARTSVAYASLPVARITVGVLAACAVTKYFWLIPAEFSSTDEVIPLPVQLASQFVMFAFYILFSKASQDRAWLPWALLFLAFELATNTLRFNKTVLIGTLLFASLGWFSHRLDWKRVLVAGLGLIIIFELAVPLVSYGRTAITEGGVPGATLGDRAALVRSYLAETADSSGDRLSYSWSRLNYLPVQKAAIDLYDDGYGSEDWTLIGWLFIPRFLYPDKPSITGSGMYLYEKISGQQESSVAAGLFVDAYYNGGLLVVLLVSVLLGISLSFTTDICRGIVEGHGDLLFPLVALAIYRGLRIDGTILADFSGGLIVFCLLLAIVAALNPLNFKINQLT